MLRFMGQNSLASKRKNTNERLHPCGVICIRIIDPRSLRSWYIKVNDEPVTRVASSVPLMHHVPSDLGSLILIQITQKGRNLTFDSHVIRSCTLKRQSCVGSRRNKQLSVSLEITY